MRTAPADRHKCEQVLETEGWHLVKVKKEKLEPPVEPYLEMVYWCEGTLGPGRLEPSQSNWFDSNDVWYSFTWYGYHTFYFKHSRDATAFALRWV